MGENFLVLKDNFLFGGGTTNMFWKYELKKKFTF